VTQESLRIDPYRPHPTRLDPSHPMFVAIMRSHDEAIAQDRGGYLDPGTGLFVMTAEHHIRRGQCCHNGCRHCPYLGAEGES
jgi:hypothetical protein